MRVAVYNAAEQGKLVHGEVLPVLTYEQGVDAWRSRKANAFLKPQSANVPRGARPTGDSFTRYMILLTPRVVPPLTSAGTGYQVLSGKLIGASPEERNDLAWLMQKLQMSRDAVKDIGIITQESYLKNPECVDVYCTSVTRDSPFLQSMSVPFYCSPMPSAFSNTIGTYDPSMFMKSINITDITTSTVSVNTYQ